MAESYRGLTIRIGGDTTGLQKALKTSTSAIQGADMELRKLGQALKLDPGNVEAFNLQLVSLGDKATSTAMKLYQMQQAAEQIRKIPIAFDESGNVEQTLGELAKETENVHLNAEKAKASFNKVRDELHGMYETLTQYNEKAVKTDAIKGQFDELGNMIKGVLSLDNLAEGFDLSGEIDVLFDELEKKFNEFNGVVAKPEGFEELRSRLKDIVSSYGEIEDAEQKAILGQTFIELAKDASTATAQVVNFENELTSLGDIGNIANVLTDALGLDPEKVQTFINSIGDFKGAYTSAMGELKQANQIAQLFDLDVEIERAKSSIASLAKAIANMDVPSDLMRGMNDLTEEANAFKKAFSESMNRANAAAQEFKIDPTNIKASETAMKEYAEAQKNATARQTVLNEQLSKFDSSKIDKWASSTETATEQLVNASVEHARATESLKKFKGAIEGANAMYQSLVDTASKKDQILDKDSVIEASESLKRLLKEYEKFDDANEEAKRSIKENLIKSLLEFKDAAEQAGDTDLVQYFSSMIGLVNNLGGIYHDFADAQDVAKRSSDALQDALERRDFENTRADVTATTKAFDEAGVAMQKLAAGDFKMDTKWIEDLKNARSDLESLGSSVAQEFQQATASISALGGVTDTATTKAKALIDAFASDMGNTDALRLGLDSLNEAFVASTTKAEMLRNLIASYTPDRIDEVAISTGKVGENAATAAAEVKVAFKSLDDAKKKLADLEEAYKKALSVRTDESMLEQYRNDIAAAREEVEKWKVASENALKNLDTAKATQEFVNLRQELARTDADFEKLSNDAKAIAESLATGGAESFAKRVFGDMDAAIDGARGALDNAIDRFTKLSGAMETLHGKSAAAAQQQSAMGEVLSAGSAYVQKLSQSYENLSESISPDRIVELKKQYGDLSTASEQTSEKVRLLAQQLVAASTAGNADEVKRLTDELIKATEAANKVATALKLEGLSDAMVTSVAEVKEKLKEAIGSDIGGMFKSMFAELEGSKGVFDAAATRLSTLSKAMRTLEGDAKVTALQQKAMGEAAAAGASYEDKLADALALVSKYVSPERVEELKNEYGDLGTAARETAKKVEELANKILEAALAGDNDGMKKLIAQYEDLKRVATEAAAAKMGQDVSDESVRVLTAQKEAIESGTKDSAAAYEQMFSRITQYAERAAGAIVESANTIDAAYRDMRKTVNGTEEDFEHLRDAAIAFSQTHAVSADTILEMESLGGQLGVTVEALEDFGRVSSNLDIATDIGAEDIALQLGQITNIMSDLDFTTFENFADALVRLGNNVAAQESSIMNVAQRIAAVANVTSMTTPQLLGWSAAIASTGQRSESAATAITNSITGIGKAVSEGGDKLDAFAKIAGMSADEFKEKWENSSSEALEAFVIGLGQLTDNSTDAIDALDSVGISSVRQETALLALSQTVGNLHNSVTMATDAFNGVSDQWGDAGDAAREADQKSQGFSGTLQILKNNLADLAASVGDALILPMQLASEVLKSVTTIINILPDEVTGLAVSFVALTAAGGVVAKTLDDVKKVLKSMSSLDAATTLGTVATKLKDFVSSLGGAGTAATETAAGAGAATTALAGVGTAAEGAAVGSEAAAGAMATTGTAAAGASSAVAGLSAAFATGFSVVAIGLVIAAIAALAGEVAKAIENHNKLTKAQDDLSAAGKRLASAAQGATGSQKDLADAINGVKVTIDDTIKYVDELTRKENELAETMEGRNFDMEFDLSRLNEAKEVIDRLANSTHALSYTERAELQDAVKTMNDVMGTSYKVFDEVNGTITEQNDLVELTTEQLDKLIGEYERTERGDVAFQNSTDAAKALAEAESEVAEKQAQLDEVTANLGESTQSYVAASKDAVDANIGMYTSGKEVSGSIGQTNITIEQATEQLERAQQHLEQVKASQQEATDAAIEFGNKEAAAAIAARDAMVKTLEGAEAFSEAFDTDSGGSIETLSDHLIQLGATTEDIANLTDYQFTKMAQSYDGTLKSLIGVLDELGISFENAGDAAKNMADKLNEASKATQEAIDEQTRANQHAYDALKRELDHQYDAEKDSRDKTYEMKKREYDSEYDLLKKELDHQYDAEKDKQDKIYDAQKKAYDREYDKLKDKYDKEYTLAKRAYDEEYDALKTSLDREYDALKDAYDEEYDLRKQSLDDQYNAVKDSYDKQVEALKDSLDEQYNSLKDSLDKQYDALKDSLDKQYDEVKKSLDSVYDAYKDELDDQYDLRKTALDKEYNALKTALDKEKEARKKELDAEVEDVKESLDDAYEVRKKALDKEYKAYQKASQKYLKQFKKEQTAQVDAFKKATDARVSELKRELEAQQAIIDAETKRKTNAIDERIAALKGETDAENREKRERERAEKTAELQNAVDVAKSRRTRAEAEKELNDYLREIAMEDAQERREQLISELEDERGAIEEDGKERKDQLDGQYNAEIEAFKESRALELEILQEHLDERYEVEQEAEAARLEKIKENQTAELEAIKEQHAAEIEAMKERNTLELETIAEQNALKLEAMKANHDAELEVLKEQNDAKLAAMKEQHDAELETMKEQNEARLEAVKEQNEAQLSALKEANEAQVNAAKDANEASLLELKRANDEELNELKKWQGDQLQAVKDSNDLILQQKKYEHEDALQALKDYQGFELQALKDGQEQQLQYLKDNQEAWLTTIKENNEGILNQKKLDNADALQALKDDQELELRTIKEGHEDKLTALKEYNEDLIKAMKDGTGQVKTDTDETTSHVDSKYKDMAENAKANVLGLYSNVTEKLLGVKITAKSETDEMNKAVTGNFDGMTKDVEKTLGESGKNVENGLVAGTKYFTDETGEMKKVSVDNAEELDKDVTGKLGDTKNKVETGLDDTEKKFSSTGDNINKTTKSNVKDYTDTVSDGMDTAKTDVEDGVGDMEDAIGDADLAGSIQGPLGELQNVLSNLDTYSWGSDMMQNFGRGMESAIGYVSNVAQTVASNVSSWMGHSVPEKGEWHEGGKGEVVWGQDLMDNFIEGIVSKEQALADALEGLAEVVEEKFDPSLPIDELEQYVAYAKTAYNAQEGDLNRHAANVEEQYAVMFDAMRRQLGEFAEVYVMNDREMYAKSLALLNEHVDRTYEEHADMYDRLASYTERYVDSIAAAYEAIDDITRGNIDRQVQVSVQGQSAQPVINVNVTLSDVTIRETADIDKLAQQLAKRVDQVTRSRIGR